jgi:hypothetical protein
MSGRGETKRFREGKVLEEQLSPLCFFPFTSHAQHSSGCALFLLLLRRRRPSLSPVLPTSTRLPPFNSVHSPPVAHRDAEVHRRGLRSRILPVQTVTSRVSNIFFPFSSANILDAISMSLCDLERSLNVQLPPSKASRRSLNRSAAFRHHLSSFPLPPRPFARPYSSSLLRRTFRALPNKSPPFCRHLSPAATCTSFPSPFFYLFSLPTRCRRNSCLSASQVRQSSVETPSHLLHHPNTSKQSLCSPTHISTRDAALFMSSCSSTNRIRRAGYYFRTDPFVLRRP